MVGQYVKVCFIVVKIGTQGVFEITDYESSLRILECNIVENWCSGFVEVADDESSFKFLKFKMADQLWRINIKTSNISIEHIESSISNSKILSKDS